jgi:hypothetical protein
MTGDRFSWESVHRRENGTFRDDKTLFPLPWESGTQTMIYATSSTPNKSFIVSAISQPFSLLVKACSCIVTHQDSELLLLKTVIICQNLVNTARNPLPDAVLQVRIKSIQAGFLVNHALCASIDKS